MPRLAERAKRRVIARMLEVSKRAEARYVRALRGIVGEIQTKAVEAVLKDRSDATTALSSQFDLIMADVIAAVPGKVGPVFDRHASDVAESNRRALRVAGIKQFTDVRLREQLALRREENINLVVNAGRVYADQVKSIFEDPANFGLRTEDLKAKLLERGDVSDSRAELIARDQTLKLNGAITQIRQENVGIDSYVWSTSLDERVRDEHAALEGQTFAWSSPPEPGHPGEDINCRCVALPVIAELSDL